MIGLIDCNNFYASCERVFQPYLVGRPLLILSNNDGCAISRSDEAKALGIEMGTPHFLIEDLIKQHNVEIRSSNYTLYGDMSERVMNVIKSFVPKVEVYSIDEIFVDLTELRNTDLFAHAIEIRKTVKQHTGIPVSVGIAPTKTLAKMANRYAKKEKKEMGVHIAYSIEDINTLLNYTAIGDIWGIGKQHEKLLLQHGFTTAADLVKAPEEWIRKNLTVVGLRLLKELNGLPCIKWEETPPPKKNICTARSFGELLTNKKDIQEAVAAHTASCGAKLRKENSCARKIHVFLQTNPFREQDEQYSPFITLLLPVPTNSTKELISYAMKGLEAIFQAGYRYKKVGVMVLDLVPSTQIQLGLFDAENREKDTQLMKTLDKVNRAYGKDVVRFGVQGYGKKWKLRQQKLSPCFTTRLEHIMKVKAE